MTTLSGGDNIVQALEEIARRMGGGSVSVGFMDNATYPDGTPVAAVAFWNEFGTSKTPARPFFRNMIAAESTTWAPKMAGLATATGNDGQKVLGMMGEDIAGALKQSINNTSSPPNAASTIKAKKGANKPLIDTAVMINSITYKVSP